MINPNSRYCCGCLACKDICPKQAITKTVEENGFIVPSIDLEKCVDCGLCEKICDFKKEHNGEPNIQKAYSLKVKDPKVLNASTSGGAFTAISDQIFNDGGIVVGSVMDDNFIVHHEVADKSMVRDLMRGSKYVQSDTDGIFRTIRNILKTGRKVLFTGSPCQCAALRSYLGEEYKNLIVMDFLCHGVPGNKMFKEHIEFLEDRYGKQLVSFSFRNKEYGWDSYNNIAELKGGQKKAKLINQAYYRFFSNNLSLRQSCYNCPYRSLNRPSDLTMGDFWGIGKLTGKKDNTGVSLILTHSEKAENLLERCRVDSEIFEYPVSAVLPRVSVEPCRKNKKYERFWETYRHEGYQNLVKRFFDESFPKIFRFNIRKIGKKFGLLLGR